MQKIDDTHEPESVEEVRDRHTAFLHWFGLYGGNKGQEVADVGYLLSKLDAALAVLRAIVHHEELLDAKAITKNAYIDGYVGLIKDAERVLKS